MPSQDSPSRASVAFGQACADLARQHPFKVMTIVGGAFFCVGLAASLPLGMIAAPQTAPIAPAPAIASGSESPPPDNEPSVARGNSSNPNAPNCDKQTWPYLDRPCLDALAAKAKATPQVRVVSTDRETPSTLETINPAEPKAVAAAPQPESTDAAPLTPIAPAAPVQVSTPAVPAAPPSAMPDPPVAAVAAKEDPRGGVPPADSKAAAGPKPKAIASAATAGEAPEPPAASPAKAKKKERAQRAKPEKENKSGATMLVRDTYSYPDGRQVAVVHRVKKNDGFRAAEPDDEEETAAPSEGSSTLVGMRSSRTE